MSKKILKGFQETAVNSGLDLFMAARELLNAAGSDLGSRKRAINHNGYLLIEAPTGSGKTLIGGTIVEKFSYEENVVWFWFAPFKGVVDQTIAFVNEEFQGLKVRDLAEDREATMSQPGNVFVTTWAAVATRLKDKRNIRKAGDLNPSLDQLVEQLRSQGVRIGVVVDEAHHGFGENTLAAKFCREVLQPEYTILITATPDDKEIKAFEKVMEIAELHRIRISREDAVDSGLIKEGVRSAAYIVPPEHRALVDLEGTALRDGVSAHRTIKKKLKQMNIPLVPLLLVQADSKEGSVERLKTRLLRMGFTEEQVAVHTALEPDSGLLALANDPTREVLIFKMAVALGFDAPRAFTLVSMRASRDADFGVQLIGRILRVHRLLHGRAQAKKLPIELTHGLVFLAVPESQEGLDMAGQKINSIKTAYAKASTATIVVRVGENFSGVAQVHKSGQVEMFGLETEVTGGGQSTSFDAGEKEPPEFEPSDSFDFGGFYGEDNSHEDDKPKDKTGRKSTENPGEYRFSLRSDVPCSFKTQVVSADNAVTEEDCAQRFMISTRDLFEVMRNRIPVEKRTLNVFTYEIQQEFNFAADLSPTQAALTAEKVLCRSKIFDPRALRKALLVKMQMVMRDETMAEAEDHAKVAHFLDVILATHPSLLWDAQKKAMASAIEIIEASELPQEFIWNDYLQKSPRNVYGIYPPQMNSWEREFCGLLDSDPNKIVKWWHRNLPDKPWSVNVLMENGSGFYPDFIIGIDGRKKESGALLADPKERFESSKQTPKLLAEHGTYGKVLILAKDGVLWKTVEYDNKNQKAILAHEFRLSDMIGY